MKTATVRRANRVLKQPARRRSTRGDDAGLERRGIIICPDCGNVHYKKQWWHNTDRGLHKLVVLNYRTAAHTLCPACTLAKQHLFEGELVVEQVPIKFRKDLGNLIKNFGKTAREIDPQDRILALERTEKTWRITTTENQLADRLAKKIRETFKKHATIHISHSMEPYAVDRVHAIFNI